MRGWGVALLLLMLAACGRQERATSAPPSAPPPPVEPPKAQAWSWHPVGSLAVVEGEVWEPTELRLEGRSIRETRFAEPGPVRWEIYRPPPGESAVLRTASGRELARFHFSIEPNKPQPLSIPASEIRVKPGSSRSRAETLPQSLAKKPLPEKPLPPPPAQAPAQASALPSGALSPGSLFPWPGMGEALNLTRGPMGQKRLLLSFDGGSSNEVAAEVLDLLRDRGIRTTLFLTGAFIQRFPDLVRRMAAEGHELGNHTMNHPHFAPGMKRDPKWTRERVQRELLEADAALVRLLGRPMDPYWRAPYGEHTAEIRRWAEELGYRHVGWSEGADTLDWATPKEPRLYRSGEAIVSRLQKRLDSQGDGLIVLMHLGSERSLGDRPTDGLGAFMDRARREGWTFVTAGSFLKDLGKPVWDSQPRLALLNAPSQSR